MMATLVTVSRACVTKHGATQQRPVRGVGEVVGVASIALRSPMAEPLDCALPPYCDMAVVLIGIVTWFLRVKAQLTA
jgi:hypothetical protein